MATIGPIKLSIKIDGANATADVTYDIRFSKTDVKKGQGYEEECRLIGDDTHAGDPAAAGGDDHIEFLSPMFNNDVKADGSETLPRQFTKSFRAMDLNEDRNDIPNPDEIRARVTLRPAGPSKGRPTQRESPMVKVKLG